MHDILLCVFVQAGVCVRGQCSVVWLAGWRRCHKPQDVEGHLSPSLFHTHEHTHSGSMYWQGKTLIIRFGGAPRSNIQPADRKFETNTQTHTYTWIECSTGHKISYMTMISQSSQNSEMKVVYRSTLWCLFAVHQLSCWLFAHHIVYPINDSMQSKHLQNSVLCFGSHSLEVQYFNKTNLYRAQSWNTSSTPCFACDSLCHRLNMHCIATKKWLHMCSADGLHILVMYLVINLPVI